MTTNKYANDRSFATITFVVRLHDGATVPIDDPRPLLTDDEIMFWGGEIGISDTAIELGAEPDDWADSEPDDGRLYEKCASCHLFIEENDQYGGDNYDRDDIAEYVHLHRGTPEDEAIDNHEALPSGMRATLKVWKQFGPREMRERFTGAWVCEECTAVILDLDGVNDQHEPHCSLHTKNVT